MCEILHDTISYTWQFVSKNLKTQQLIVPLQKHFHSRKALYTCIRSLTRRVLYTCTHSLTHKHIALYSAFIYKQAKFVARHEKIYVCIIEYKEFLKPQFHRSLLLFLFKHKSSPQNIKRKVERQEGGEVLNLEARSKLEPRFHYL